MMFNTTIHFFFFFCTEVRVEITIKRFTSQVFQSHSYTTDIAGGEYARIQMSH